MLVHFYVHLYLLNHLHVSLYLSATDVTRSQTGDSDWEHKPKSKLSYLCGKKENYAQAATVS